MLDYREDYSDQYRRVRAVHGTNERQGCKDR